MARRVQVHLQPWRFVRYERQIGLATRAFLQGIVRQAAKTIMDNRRKAPRLTAEASRLDYPSRELVLARWNRVKDTLKISDPHRWDPRNFPMDFEAYRAQMIDAQTTDRYATTLASIKATTYKTAAGLVTSRLGKNAEINLDAIAAMEEKAVKIVTTDLLPTIERQVRERIETAISQGMSGEETAHSLGFLNTNWRTIARTETFDALNQGAWDQINAETNETGATTLKGWLHSGGGRDPRESHIQAGVDYGAGNEIPLDQPFIVGGEQMLYPHDPAASAENTINCGCSQYFVVK